MKNNTKNSSLDNSQVTQKHIEHKYFNRRANKGYMITNNQNNDFQKKNSPLYNTIETEIDNSKNTNFNSNTKSTSGKYYPYNNKDYFYKDYYEIQTYHPNENESNQDYDNKTSIHLKPFPIPSQSYEKKKNLINKLNKDNNYEDNNYPSNYSYYESKCIKKKKKVPNKNNIQSNSNFSILYSNNNENKKLNLSNKNLNKSFMSSNNQNNRYETNNSPSKKNENEYYYYNKSQKNTINSLVNSTSENKKKNIVLKKAFNMDDIKPFNQYSNAFVKTIVQQPRTPNVYYSKARIYTPKNNIEEYSKVFEKNSNNNKNERNIPSKSTENIVFKKLVSIHQKIKKEISHKELMNKNEDSKINMTEPFNINIDKITSTPPKEMNYSINNNSIININNSRKRKNKVFLGIRDDEIEYNNIIKNIHFNTAAKPKNQEHFKNNSAVLNEFKEKNEIKTEKKISKEIKQPKQNIIEKKKLDANKTKKISSSSNNIIKTVIYKNNNREIGEKISKNKENRNTLNNIINKQNYEEEKKYMKEIENIMYDNYTEPRFQVNYAFKENNNRKTLNANNINKGRIWEKKEKNEKNENKNYFVYNENKNNKNNNKNNNNNLINNKTKNNNSYTNINSFEYKKGKSYEINIPNADKKIYTKKISHNRNKNILKPNNSQMLNDRNSIKIENKVHSNNEKKNLMKKIPINKLSQATKITNSISHSNIGGTLSIKEIKKEEPKPPKPHRNLSELPKHISRLDEVSRNKKKTGEEWDNMQYRVLRKKTYDVGRRYGVKNKNYRRDKLDEEFSSVIYVKKSEALSLAGKNEFGKKKTNQDTFVIEKNINGILNFNIFGVLDGHGDDGHFASQFVKRYVIHRIKNHPLIKKLDEPKEIYKQLISNHYEIISNIYLDADIQIQKEKFDFQRSGTTIVLVIQLEEHIICANSGDSRAIAIYDESLENNNLINSKIFPLSYDCKPQLPNEKKRIYKCGGEVEKIQYPDADSDDEHIPFRVWVKGKDYPGLAMSRSIGDIDAKKVGVIPNPQIVEYIIGYSTKYILICSDGIWEFMKNEDCMKIANKFYLRNDPVGLCNELCQASIRLWEKKEIVIDDITVLVVFF